MTRRYAAVQPPSATMAAPFTKLPSSETRKRIRFAISSAAAARGFAGNVVLSAARPAWLVPSPEGSRAIAVATGFWIMLFARTWPVFNTIADLSVNVAVLVTQLSLRWPEPATFGR